MFKEKIDFRLSLIICPVIQIVCYSTPEFLRSKIFNQSPIEFRKQSVLFNNYVRFFAIFGDIRFLFLPYLAKTRSIFQFILPLAKECWSINLCLIPIPINGLWSGWDYPFFPIYRFEPLFHVRPGLRWFLFRRRDYSRYRFTPSGDLNGFTPHYVV